jgi:hypothetical protein
MVRWGRWLGVGAPARARPRARGVTSPRRVARAAAVVPACAVVLSSRSLWHRYPLLAIQGLCTASRSRNAGALALPAPGNTTALAPTRSRQYHGSRTATTPRPRGGSGIAAALIHIAALPPSPRRPTPGRSTMTAPMRFCCWCRPPCWLWRTVAQEGSKHADCRTRSGSSAGDELQEVVRTDPKAIGSSFCALPLEPTWVLREPSSRWLGLVNSDSECPARAARCHQTIARRCPLSTAHTVTQPAGAERSLLEDRT